MYVEIGDELGRAVRLLCHAIGLNSVPKPGGEGVEVMIDGALLSALVQIAKGKKLLARSIHYLNPAQRLEIDTLFSR